MNCHNTNSNAVRNFQVQATVLVCILIVFSAAYCSFGAEAPTGDEQLLAEVKAALEQEAAKLLAPVVVFPTVDANNQIRPGGVVLSRLAQYKIAYAPRRRMAISMNYLSDLLSLYEIATAGEVLGEVGVRACIAALEADSYVIPRLTEAADGWTLTLDFHGTGTESSSQATHHVPVDELGRVPEFIATAVLERIDVEVSPEESQLLTQSEFADQAGLVFIEESWQNGLPKPTDELLLRQFVEQYPTNPVGWEVWLRHSSDPSDVVDRYDRQRAEIQCERLEIEAAITERRLARPRKALVRLLPLARTQHDEVYYYGTLTRTAMALGDDQISAVVLEEWRRAGQRYIDYCRRGEFLIDWAWQARGNGWAASVKPEAWGLFGERIRAARDELEQAVDLDPKGFVAHTELITVAKSMGLPYEYMNKHFEAAIQIRPTYRPAYISKLEFLTLRWGGTPQRLIAFGKECLDTGLWDDGISPLFIDSLVDATWSRDQNTFDATAFQDDKLWQLIKYYYNEATEHGTPLDKRRALNFFVLFGALGGKYADVREACDRLYASRYRENRELDNLVFSDTVEFILLRERVLAQADEGLIGQKSSIRVALFENRYEDAARLLDNYKPDDGDVSAVVQHYRRSLALGVELEQKGRLLFEGDHLQHAFDWLSVDVDGPIPGNANGRRFEWTPQPTNEYWNDLRLAFPVGTSTADWSGELAWTPDIKYFDLTWRLSGPAQHVQLRCYPHQSQMMIVKNNVRRYQAPLPPSPLRFQIQVGNRQDVVKVNDDIVWELELSPPSPGLFAVHAITEVERMGTFAISNLELSTQK